MKKILLVEDERNFAQVLRDFLNMNGYAVTLAGNGEEGEQAFDKERFDLCILDVMMPRKDGFTLAKQIRASDRDLPLIFLTARSMREDVLRGYMIGADDYLVKPFDSEVLLMKLRAILSRSVTRHDTEALEHALGDLVFNAKLRTLRKGSEETRLSPKESDLLQLLCVHRNDVLPREKALKQIWKDSSYFTARSMDVYIARLRKLLASEPKISIESLHGNGFSLRVR